jgi:hypothetical protein
MLEDIQQRGVIEVSDSPWSSPIVLVRKKNPDLCFCIYYRKLNDVMRKDCFPLPRIDDTLDTLAGAKWFSTLDLKSSYWHVDLHLDDKEKTAFSRGQGLWQFTVMPLGLTGELYLVYLDDIIVIGRMFQDHLLNLRKVFQWFHEAHLRLNPEKCQLFQ